MILTRDAGLKLLTSPPVFDALYEYCGPGTLCRVAKTCNGAHQAVDNYLTHTLNATRLFARFFGLQDALEFRRLQAQLEFIVSGSQALQLLGRTVYPKSDLDIYVFPLDAERLGHWLIAHGYQYLRWNAVGVQHEDFDAALAAMPPLVETATRTEILHHEKYGIPNVRDAFNFKKRGPGSDLSVPLEDDHHALQVQIIVADITPVQVVLGFHATMVMNFITWNRVFSLYPAGTFEHRRALVTYDKDRHFDLAMIKYAARGFRIDSHLFDDETARGPFKFGTRWVVKLDTTGITPPEIPVAWDVNSWTLGRHAEHRTVSLFGPCATKTFPLRSIMFRHRYCITDDFFKFMLAVLKEQGPYEYERLRATDLAPGMGPGYGEEKPEGFVYRDTDLPKYKESYFRTEKAKKEKKPLQRRFRVAA
ncbi:hypothetical protein EXIGLDRAFT_717624 [Exidia glandulosa HHB12029]|uniref:Uncharacterized protein n=1 Tax=Exidia glandulosa HHB12029 TaxID=1314781 RepID=A0A165I9M9_EXIGL|nr:hypothetical protein EXIGLDRAFT_717624 [Exidia glandulosa HHB12029]